MGLIAEARRWAAESGVDPEECHSDRPQRVMARWAREDPGN